MWKIAMSVAGSFILCSAAQAAAPNRFAVGQCVTSKVAAIDATNGSVSLTYENGIKQVSDKASVEMRAVKVGEPVALCIGRLGSPCAQGSTRGAVYHAKSLGSGKDWLAPDRSGKCGHS